MKLCDKRFGFLGILSYNQGAAGTDHTVLPASYTMPAWKLTHSIVVAAISQWRRGLSACGHFVIFYGSLC